MQTNTLESIRKELAFLFIPIVILTLSFYGYLHFVHPSVVTLKLLENEIADLEAKVTKRGVLLDSISTVEERLKQSITTPEYRIAEMNQASLLFSTIAESSGLTVVKSTPRDGMLSIEVKGYFSTLLKFVESIETIPYTFQIEQLSISKRKNLLSATVSAKVFLEVSDES